MCVNNFSYHVKGVRIFIFDAINRSIITLLDALYVSRIKKNLLSVCTLAKNDLVMKFMDDRSKVYDIRDYGVVVAFGSLCRGLYRMDSYG